MANQLFPRRFLLFILAVNPLLLSATVFVNRADSEEGVTSCKGTVARILCTTTTRNGFLLWQNSSGKDFGFDADATLGDTGSLGTTTMTLTSVEPVSDAVVYTSTASENMIENTTKQCSDGEALQSVNVTVKSPSSPSWAHSACSFSQDSVRLSWNAPSVAPECCANYTVQLSTGIVNTTDTSVAVQIGDESITATVYCVGSNGETEKTEDMTINPSGSIEHVIIEPIAIEPLHSSLCNGNTMYRISWITTPGVCTPPITMSTITCTTSSTHQSSNNTRSMICSVLAIETINATVTITNAAGVTTSRSVSADALARSCQNSNMSPVHDNQLSSSGVAAVIMSLLTILLTVLWIVLLTYLVINRTYCKRKASCDVTYSVATTKCVKEKDEVKL